MTYEELVKATTTGDMCDDLLALISTRGKRKGLLKKSVRTNKGVHIAVMSSLNMSFFKTQTLMCLEGKERKNFFVAEEWANYYKDVLNAIFNANIEYSLWAFDKDPKKILETFEKLVKQKHECIKHFSYSEV